MREEKSGAITALRPLTAAALLGLRETALAMDCDAAARGLWGNALVLAACCRCGERAAFESAQAVLDALTTQEMERLLRALASGGAGGNESEETANPRFDAAHFAQMKGDEALGLH